MCITVFAPWLFAGKAFYWGDIGLFFIPLSHFLKQNIASGTIPLWNPYLFCGAPFVGNPQVSVLYPSTLLLPLFSTAQALMISEVAHIFAAGLFFWLFSRYGALKLSSCGAILSATVYMLGGYYVAKAQFPNMLAALTYVPVLLYQTELLVQTPTLRRSAVFGLFLGLQLLGAHTQITVFTLYLLIPYAFFVFYMSPVRESFWRVLFIGVLGGTIAAGLACAYWLPVAELIHSSARQALTLKMANRFYLPWYELGNFVMPHLYGSPMRGDWRARGNYWETNNYVALVPAGLAIYFVGSVVLKKPVVSSPRGQILFWAIVFIISVWMALGSEGGLYRLAFVVVPALNAFHDPARLMLGANIAVALFAGAGLESIKTNFPQKLRIAAISVLIVLSCLDLGWQDRGIYPLKKISTIEKMQDAAVPQEIFSRQSSAGAGRILMPDSRRAWQSFTTYKHYSSNDPAYMQEWPDTLAPCLAMADNIKEVGGYDPEYRRDSQFLVDLADAPVNTSKGNIDIAPSELPGNYANYLSMLAVQFLVTYRVDNLRCDNLVEIYRSPWQRQGRRVQIYENTAYGGRAFLYTIWQPVSSQNNSFSLISDRLNLYSWDKKTFNIPAIENIAMSGDPNDYSVTAPHFIKDQPDDVILNAPSSTHSTLLVLADTMHPGWISLLDGTPCKMFRANVDQRAVYIAPSDKLASHIVEFIYKPADFRVGLYVTLLTLMAILMIMISSKGNSNLNF